MTAGYSATPLLKKLGIKPGFTIWFVNAPENYADLLGPLPDGVQIKTEAGTDYDFIHFFTKTQDDLAAQLPLLKTSLAKSGMLWLSWPKKAAKVPTDLDGNIVREMGLAQGLVDVKIAAIDSIWSGLKFVYRTKDR